MPGGLCCRIRAILAQYSSPWTSSALRQSGSAPVVTPCLANQSQVVEACSRIRGVPFPAPFHRYPAPCERAAQRPRSPPCYKSNFARPPRRLLPGHADDPFAQYLLVDIQRPAKEQLGARSVPLFLPSNPVRLLRDYKVPVRVILAQFLRDIQRPRERAARRPVQSPLLANIVARLLQGLLPYR